ncbi:HAUS augmin-like complex subunit 7 [Rana temporaria]|uniref:HAUS augmin-like complex subunit 7 n=1 Tax=Rana temporaria TaxID=8407 RepID=UPI001AACECA0|nr:HAUS augmin-like complex subunit 7 [Rana temporaria]
MVGPVLKMAGSTALRKAELVYERLKKLSCLPLEGVYVSSPENIHELLCTPSVIRLGVLEWLCTRAYPPLQKQFSTLKESEGEIKIKEMAKLGFELMLCHEGDVDLIKGLVPSSRQLFLMESLLNIIEMPRNISRVSGLECSSESVDEAFTNCAFENEKLLHEIFYSHQLQATLTPECNPWPADLQPLLLKKELPESAHQSDKNTIISQHLEELQKISTALHELKEECTFLCIPVPGSETVIQTLKLAMTDFHQLIAAFTQVYENEFQEHCNHPAPRLSPCGPLFQSVYCLLESCSQELKAVAQFTETSNTITEVVRKRQQIKESFGGGSTVTLYEKIKEIKHNYELFLSALQ